MQYNEKNPKLKWSKILCLRDFYLDKKHVENYRNYNLFFLL